MSREIKFRAKSLKTNEFVFGFFGQRTETSPVRETTQTYTINYILVDNGFCGFEEIEIDIKTLGQFTGLLDKNGKEIYEGDSVQKIYKGKAYQVCEVKFNDGTFVVDDFDADGKKFFWSLRGMQHCWKVVGNIYEHKELITEVKNG